MVRFGSAYGLARAVFVLSLWVVGAGCGGGKSDPDAPGPIQAPEMTTESGFGGEESDEAEENVEPADHDIEVPPAP